MDKNIHVRKIVSCILLCLFILGVLIFFIPDNYIPARWKPFVSVTGRFEHKPIRFVVPELKKPNVSVNLKISMEKGICKVSRINPDGKIQWTMNMERGTVSDYLPPQTVLQLDSEQNTGHYSIVAGLPWHPLAPQGRLILLVSSIVGLVSYGIGIYRKDWAQNIWIQKFRTKRRYVVVVVILFIISGLLSSMVHEFGHIAFGILCGGKANWQGVVWTGISGEEPHASFYEFPADAKPWMMPGGIIFPTGVGLLLVSIWLLWANRLTWYLAASVLIPGIILLLGNLGITLELIFTGHSSHMEGPARYYHFSVFWTLAWELMPLLLTLTAYILIGYRVKKLCKKKEMPVS